jgi:hypothetical protein
MQKNANTAMKPTATAPAAKSMRSTAVTEMGALQK